MPIYTIQPSFSGGEFSPSLYSRVDVQKYATGLKKAKNFIIHPHGGASNRSGTEFIRESKLSTKKVRGIPFEFSLDQAFFLEFGENYIRFVKDGGYVLAGDNSIYEVVTTYSESEIDDVKYIQSADVIFFFHPSTPTKRLTRYSDNNWTFDDAPFVNGPFIAEKKTSTMTIAPSSLPAPTIFSPLVARQTAVVSLVINVTSNQIVIPAEAASFSSLPESGDFLFFDNYPLVATTVTSVYPDIETGETYIEFYPGSLTGKGIANNSSQPISFFKKGNAPGVTPTIMAKGQEVTVTLNESFFEADHVGSLLKASQFVQGSSTSKSLSATGATDAIAARGTWRLNTRGTWGGTIEVQKAKPETPTAWETIRQFSHNSVDFNIDAFSDEDELCLLRVELVSYSSGTVAIDLSCDAYTNEGIVKITAITSVNSATATIVSPVLGDVAIISWQEGSWSKKRGFPSCGVFYQDRFVLGATSHEPQGSWFSKTGNYYDFGTSSPLQDTDAVNVNLPSRKMNGIKNLVSLAEVLAFTSASECSIGDSGGVFTPTTVKTKVHGYRGSTSTDPVVVGNKAIVVQSMGSVVRDFGYDFSSDGFTGADLSIFSTHLFKNFSITEMAYQQEPDSLVWCVRSDGKLLSMTYMKEQEVVAWTQHETDGLFESVCSIPGNGQNDVYFVVNREGKRYIERLSKRLPIIDSKEAFFVDSGLTYRGAPTSTISGLNHLEGKTVVALCDGRVVTGLVVNSGSVALPVPAELVHVGLPYVSDFQTLSIQVPMQDGSGYGRLVKVSEAKLTFLNSRGGYIGPDEENLDEVFQLQEASLSDPKKLFSGDYTQTVASGYEPGGTVFYRQTDPLPVTILAVMPKVTVGG